MAAALGQFMFGIDSVSSELLATFGMISVATFFLSLIIVPMVIVRIPEDYFAVGKRKTIHWQGLNPLLRTCLLIIKNIAGLVFLVMGILMLVLPGQGLLTILFGIALLDFPGKSKLERRLISYPKVLSSINWVRKKAKRKPLIL